MRALRIDENSPYQQLVGVGGIGTGMFFALEGNHTLGRGESRPCGLLDVRDYCKLHIIIHYVARLLGAKPSGVPFHVMPIGKVGGDASGRQLVKEMLAAGIDTQFVQAIPGSPTLLSVCFQYPNGEGGNLTTNNSAAEQITRQDVEDARRVLGARGKKTIALAAPEIPLDVRCRLLELAGEAGAFRVASLVSAEVSAARDCGMLEMLDLLAVNEDEAEELVGKRLIPDSPDDFVRSCLVFTEGHGNLRMIVTAGKNGAYAFADGNWNHCSAHEVSIASTAGAGDALLGGVIATLACGIPLLRSGSHQENVVGSALEFGVLLAGYKCLSPHTIHPDACLDTLLQFATGLGLELAPEFQQRFSEPVYGG